ncbi:MAG: acetolactate synthase small subunit, partial [Deltaproteobacteria bacterium]|nr:acetolactate synthase small subunit [Deltaproteobacteria bacterium]
EKLVDVVEVSDLTGPSYIQREMMLIGVPVMKQENHSDILRAIEMFGCRIVTMSPDYYVLEITGLQDETAAVLKYFQPFGVQEMNRTGSIALLRHLSNKISQ